MCLCAGPYTSLLLRERLAKARQKSDSVLKALRRLSFEKFTEVALQPLQTIPGREHGEVCAAASEAVAEDGLICRVGAPLLATPEDVQQAALALTRHLPSEREAGEDVVLMGHGAGMRPWPVMKIWPVPCAIWMRMCMWGQ